MKELEYPFQSEYILKKRKSIKRALKEELEGKKCLVKKIAILGGSTTHDVKDMLELFLMNEGIVPQVYESEYNQFWQDVMFDNAELTEFAPDIIYIHTSSRNIRNFPGIQDSPEQVEALLEQEYQHFEVLWEKIASTYHCPIIQNNFELPFYRILGNKDCADIHGHSYFVSALNQKIYAYAQKNTSFFVNDIHYMASCYGLQKWADPFYWHMYKYACAVPAIPELAFNLSNIIKSVYGKNKKALVLDLDNTLWGGVVGDDGAENIEIGQETPMAQLYSEFQDYIKQHKDLGILLTVNSKNDMENALAGLSRPDSVLKPEDFLIIKANWENKDRNIKEIAEELNIGTDALVFVDDNPAERSIVKMQVPDVAVPDMGDVVEYIIRLDRSGFFEITQLSKDDYHRNEMYKANLERTKQMASFGNYEEYLKSLEMKAEISSFTPVYMSRIAQLTNKSNQFNLTTKRCSLADIEAIAADSNNITLYGKLEDKFGDNGVVSVVFGHIDTEERNIFHIDLWLMSCRVLKRDMEKAMLDSLVEKCLAAGVNCIKGYYYPTAKNTMVKEFYATQGFDKINEDEEGNTIWQFEIADSYEKKNKVIQIEEA